MASENECPHCRELLDNEGYCPNGCLDEDVVEDDLSHDYGLDPSEGPLSMGGAYG